MIDQYVRTYTTGCNLVLSSTPKQLNTRFLSGVQWQDGPLTNEVVIECGLWKTCRDRWSSEEDIRQVQEAIRKVFHKMRWYREGASYPRESSASFASSLIWNLWKQIQTHDCEGRLVGLWVERKKQKGGGAFLQWIEHLKCVQHPTNVCWIRA